jgi:hypothetical protein
MKTGFEFNIWRPTSIKISPSMIVTLILLLASHGVCFATTVILNWDADTDPNVAGYKVYYQADSSTQPYQGSGAAQGASPIDVRNQTTARISGLDPNHAYFFAVTSYDVFGTESSYSNPASIAETAPPIISVFSLPSAATSLIVPVSVFSAADNVAVTGYLITESSASPTANTKGWSATAPTSFTFSGKGSKTAYAWARDAAGNISANRSATVTIALPDTILPTIVFNSPSNGAIVSGSVGVTATTFDNIGIVRVELYINGVLTKTDSATPFSFTWNTALLANASYTLKAVAYDAAGNSATSELGVTVKNSTPVRKKRGDLNGDGRVDVTDALLALKQSVGLTPKTVNALVAAGTTDDGLDGDVAPLDASGAPIGDGQVTISDALVLLKYSVGLASW